MKLDRQRNLLGWASLMPTANRLVQELHSYFVRDIAVTAHQTLWTGPCSWRIGILELQQIHSRSYATALLQTAFDTSSEVYPAIEAG